MTFLLFSVNVVNCTVFTVISYFYIFGLLIFCLGFLLHMFVSDVSFF